MNELEKKYNLKSPAVKRLMREAAELSEPTEQYFAQPLEDNLFEWHFTIRGPPESDFEAGHYHGRVSLPPEYPMKPPSIVILTPNGRFELGKKICLSMSAHHPETWQPSWSIRTVLLALIGFMPTKGGGALGSLDYTSAERKVMAAKSIEWKCNTCQIDNKNCLLKVNPNQTSDMNEARELAAQISFKSETEKSKSVSEDLPTSTEANDITVTSTNTVTSAPITSTTTSTLRQRGAVATDQQNVSVRPPPPVPQSNFLRSFVDYTTLGCMWVITVILLLLILRRLALEKKSLTN